MKPRIALIAALTAVLLLRYYRFAEAPPLPSPAPIAGEPDIEAASGAQPAPSTSEALDGYIQEASRTYAVPVALIRAVIHVESAGDTRAVSPKGAQGLMQLMPATAAALGVRDPFDPRENVLAGARYLRFLLDRLEGDVALSLAAYNAGHEAVLRYRGVPPYPETRQYLSRIAWQLDLEMEARHGSP
jgi:soluble lytic murein transglycosylase-like protein